MKDFDDLHGQFVHSLASTRQISELNRLIIEFAKDAIKSIEKNYGKVKHPTTGADIVQNQLRSFDKIADSPAIGKTLPIVYGQQVVLFISAFETYLKDIVRLVGNKHIKAMRWPEKSAGKIDLADLDENVTIGDLVLSVIEQKGVSFQDLGATKRFFEDYLGVDITIESEFEQRIVLAAAIRHSVIHSGSVVDKKFLKQIRKCDSTIRDHYKEGEPVYITQELITEIADSFINITLKISQQLDAVVESNEA